MPARQAVPDSSDDRPVRSGRDAQRRRTRAAIVEAATELIRTGATPSVDEIATAADVSRRTVYMHFPTLAQLLLDATAGALSTTVVEDALRADVQDPVARVDALVEALLSTAEDTLPLGRKIIALTVDAGADVVPPARRGHRRMQWIATALEPLRGQVTDEQYERLATGLSVMVGWEAMVILRDVCDLDASREEQVLRWAATSLVRAVLAE